MRLISISIHAPREGCDVRRNGQITVREEFQSTHPVRGATNIECGLDFGRAISIHAPREGCDIIRTLVKSLGYISIHAPREGCDRDHVRI